MSLIRFLYFLVGIIVGTSFGLYIWSLYDQLTQAFYRQEQFVPTRIYSDVSRVALQQPRAMIEERLKTLEYTYTSTGNSLQFNLHPVDYPGYLVPQNHPQNQGDPQGPQVFIEFEPASTHLVSGIRIGQIPVNDFYLEPELVATLTRGGTDKKEIRTYLPFDQIPATLWKAIIAIEDQHFLDHNGLDPRGIARAVWVNLKTQSLAQGGSTLTQQLVKNLMARHTKNLFQKINELFLSLLLEARFDKEQILERYLNEVYLGQVGNLEVHGVAEGAEHFFGKKISDLNLAEIAMMAGLIRGPGFYSPYRYRARAVERQRLVLKKMVETGLVAGGEAQAALKLPIHLAPIQNSVTKAPFFTDYVKAELIRLLKGKLNEQDIIQSGFKVYTTLDPRLNSLAQKAVAEGTSRLQVKFKLTEAQRLEGALASVDQVTGYIRALVGGRNYSQSNFNRILNMKRQVGSTFKPVVYLTAFQKGLDPQGIPYAPGRPVQDAPWTWFYDRNQQSWAPKNYDKEPLGWIPLRTALARSVNTVAARLASEVGLDAIIDTGRKLGIESNLPKVPSLALGVAELSPIELLKVYATLANRGTQEELVVIRGITQSSGVKYLIPSSQPQPAIDPAVVDLLTDALQEVFNQGTAQSARKLGFLSPAAGKTGTTNNHRDAWFAGYTPRLTTVVWVGMDQPTDKNTALPLTGANSALPIWVDYMKAALSPEQALVPFPESPLLVKISIDSHTGKEASGGCPPAQVVTETFIRGHEPQQKSCEPNWPPPLSNEVRTEQ